MEQEIIHISDEAKDYVKQLLNLIGRSGEYDEMISNPNIYTEEWEGVIEFIRIADEEDCYVADEIEEMLYEC